MPWARSNPATHDPYNSDRCGNEKSSGIMMAIVTASPLNRSNLAADQRNASHDRAALVANLKAQPR